MAARRMIASDIFEDEFYIGLDLFERNLWIGLIAKCADDQGRIQDNAILIKSQVFPADDFTSAMVESALICYSDSGRILRYTAGGKRMIQILNWWKYQTPQWAGKSRYPAPPGWTDREKYHAPGNKIENHNWNHPGGFTVTKPLSKQVTNPLSNLAPSALNEDEEEDKDKDKEEEEEGAAAFSNSPDIQAERIFQSVTQMITFPSSKADDCIGAIRSIMAFRHLSAESTIAFLNPYFAEWRARSYSAVNTAWLTEWAISGEIPPRRSNGSGKRKRVLTGANGEQIEVDE